MKQSQVAVRLLSQEPDRLDLAEDLPNPIEFGFRIRPVAVSLSPQPMSRRPK
jgi:hypothetical protein